jgi:hypothetical protein
MAFSFLGRDALYSAPGWGTENLASELYDFEKVLLIKSNPLDNMSFST